MRRAMIAAVLLLAGCYSVDDVRKQPVVWSKTYAASYDVLANCVASRSMAIWTHVTPMHYASQQRAVVVGSSQGQSVLWEFEIQQISPTTSEVRYRTPYRSTPISGDALVERFEGCAPPA